MSQSQDIDDLSSAEDEFAAADLELSSSPASRLVLVLNSLMAAMTFGALASLVMAIGRALR